MGAQDLINLGIFGKMISAFGGIPGHGLNGISCFGVSGRCFLLKLNKWCIENVVVKA